MVKIISFETEYAVFHHWRHCAMLPLV